MVAWEWGCEKLPLLGKFQEIGGLAYSNLLKNIYVGWINNVGAKAIGFQGVYYYFSQVQSRCILTKENEIISMTWWRVTRKSGRKRKTPKHFIKCSHFTIIRTRYKRTASLNHSDTRMPSRWTPTGTANAQSLVHSSNGGSSVRDTAMKALSSASVYRCCTIYGTQL